MVFVSSAHADDLWPRVRIDLKSGELALSATAAKMSLPNPRKPDHHVLIIYTSDFNDRHVVGNCLSAIRGLGVTGKLYYKTDQQTVMGVYAGGRERPWIYSSDMFETVE